MKTCIKCNTQKELSEFNKNRTKTDGLEKYCKQCRKDYYQQSKEYIKQNARQQQKKHHAWLLSFKDKPCHDCGRSYPPVVMDFDHVPERGMKLAGITSIRSREKALVEIAKCDVVCPTCHRIRTVTRAGLLTKENLSND